METGDGMGWEGWFISGGQEGILDRMACEQKCGVLHTQSECRPGHGTHTCFLSSLSPLPFSLLIPDSGFRLSFPDSITSSLIFLLFHHPFLLTYNRVLSEICIQIHASSQTFMRPYFRKMKSRLLCAALQVLQDQAPTHLFVFLSCYCLSLQWKETPAYQV